MSKYIYTRKDLEVLKSLIDANLGYRYFGVNSKGKKIIKTIRPTKGAFELLKSFHKDFGLDIKGIYDYDYLLKCRNDLINELNIKDNFEIIEKDYFISMINKFKKRK
ncbi:hypothetical protein N2W29_003255 [Clostridium perfringens]|nr:hypothetical protein [Clostridium perfringens]EJT6155081.1 hypothetical protein [Clostridium perfringens]HAT4315884.1 hypothetical protein [Clostridium perfringens]